MADIGGIPVYKVRVTEDLKERTGIKRISLVDCPAIEENWVALSKEQPDFKLDSDKQLLFGPILVPGKPIYRRFPSGKEYYLVFEKEEIEKISRKVMASEKTIDLNYQHIQGTKVQGTVQEIWLSGSPDKSYKYGFNLPEGSLFVVAHINDSEFWGKEVKSGNVKGFSIEAFLNLELKQMKLVTAKTNSGIEVFSPEETWIINAEIKQKKEDKEVAVEDGDYILEDNTTLSVKAGKIVSVSRPDEFSKEEIAVFEKMFAPMLKKLEDRIEAIEKLSAKSKIEAEEKKTPETKSAISSALEKLERLKKANKQLSEN